LDSLERTQLNGPLTHAIHDPSGFDQYFREEGIGGLIFAAQFTEEYRVEHNTSAICDAQPAFVCLVVVF